MTDYLIKYIRGSVLTTKWINGIPGGFEYLPEKYSYLFAETDKNLYHYLVAERLRNDTNTPIVIKGFIAFLIRHWRSNELWIYKTYYDQLKKNFKEEEGKKPGSYKRNLDKEFFLLHIENEQTYIQEFSQKFDYITPEEKESILEFAHYYLDYISGQNNTQLTTQKPKQPESISFESLLIHPDKKGLLHLLHSLIENKKGKNAAIVIIALKQLGYMGTYKSNRSLFDSIVNEFGAIGTIENFNHYLNENNRRMIVDSDIEAVINVLQSIGK